MSSGFCSLLHFHEAAMAFSETLGSSGLKTVLYVDDEICFADSKSHGKRNTAIVTLANSKKSFLTPQMSGHWLSVKKDFHKRESQSSGQD